jgi:hypothetical protein
MLVCAIIALESELKSSNLRLLTFQSKLRIIGCFPKHKFVGSFFIIYSGITVSSPKFDLVERST